MKAAISRAVTSAVTSKTSRDLARGARSLRRRLTGARPSVDYFHQIDDPYSHLAAQLLAPLAERYALDLRLWLVPPPEDSAAPQRARLAAYALRDAPRVAREYGLAFPASAAPPDADAVQLAARALTAARASGQWAGSLSPVSDALWTGDRDSLDRLPQASQADADAALAEGAAERLRLGHYLGAMLHFEGEWYWGVDRLNHLEERLAGLGRDTQAGAPGLAPFRDLSLGEVPEGGRRALIEAWFSFRSPYSWIALPRLRQLARHYGAELRLRFILPMVMRGLPVPRIKSMYIVRDTKREADRLGLPFGRMVDPVGAGAERALAVLHHAVPLGLGEDFAELGLRAAFADGIALAEDDGLFDVARRAGLTDDQTRAALADETWRETAEANRQALFDAGLWGAPSYRVNGGLAHWGQDRLWALEQDLVAAMKAR